jgi:hypothetical protein
VTEISEKHFEPLRGREFYYPPPLTGRESISMLLKSLLDRGEIDASAITCRVWRYLGPTVMSKELVLLSDSQRWGL